MSARHRRANAHRRFAYALTETSDDLMRQLHWAVGELAEDPPHGSTRPPLDLLTDDQRDRLVRQRDRAEATARELHRLREEILAAATVHEATRLDGVAEAGS